MRLQAGIAAFAAALAIGGCADPVGRPAATATYDEFLDEVSLWCPPLAINMVQVSYLIKNKVPYFMDTTAQLYNRSLDPVAYRERITTLAKDNGPFTNQAIDCVVKYLPASPH
jgi:hypothetical protein